MLQGRAASKMLAAAAMTGNGSDKPAASSLIKAGQRARAA